MARFTVASAAIALREFWLTQGCLATAGLRIRHDDLQTFDWITDFSTAVECGTNDGSPCYDEEADRPSLPPVH
jgi:hypothetical protein